MHNIEFTNTLHYVMMNFSRLILLSQLNDIINHRFSAGGRVIGVGGGQIRTIKQDRKIHTTSVKHEITKIACLKKQRQMSNSNSKKNVEHGPDAPLGY